MASEHDETVRRSFERQTRLFTGEDSVFASRSPSAPSAPEAPEWVAPHDPDSIVLDVACGAGHVAEEIAPCVRQVVGVDMTPALLRIGAQRLDGAGVTNVLLQEGDGAALPFVDGSFDVVVCRSALHHFADPALQLGEMARVCRPGGRVAISDLVAPGPDVRASYDELHRRIDPSHVHCLLDDELASLVERTVGPVTRSSARGSISLPIERVLTDVADRPTVFATLRAELDGGPATGFEPAAGADGELCVTFSSVSVQAVRRPV